MTTLELYTRSAAAAATATASGATDSEPRLRLVVFESETLVGDATDHSRELCMHDMQRIGPDCKPVGIPVSYDRRTHRYGIHGLACSWSCARSYLTVRLPRARAQLEMLDHFLETVVHVKPSKCVAPPLEYLAKLAVDYDDMADAIKVWRSDVCLYSQCRRVEGLFANVSQVFEDRAARQRDEVEHSLRAAQMTTKKRRMVLETNEGRRQQMKMVRAAVAGGVAAGSAVPAAAATERRRGILELMMGGK
jgi:hypothetical protein